jgi:hypothetical protein
MYNLAMTLTEDLSYPVGRDETPALITPAMQVSAIDDIAALPTHMRDAIAGLENAQLDTPYRPGGWTVRQVVHHVADSHLNAYVRMKLAMTENAPTVKPYDEKSWADLADMRMPIAPSLQLLDGLHARWVVLLRALRPADFARTFIHPEYPDAARTLDWLVQHYSWHSRHHVAHITSLRQREGW